MMIPTHKLILADGYGSTDCQLVELKPPLAVVRLASNAYWERERITTRVVRSSSIFPLAPA